MRDSLSNFVFLFSIILFSLSSCVSKTVIESEPSDADVYINGKFKGKTPYNLKTSIPNETILSINIEKKGYHEVDTVLHKDGKINKVSRILGYIFVFPLSFDRQFKKKYKYHLTERKVVNIPPVQPSGNNAPPIENSKLTKLKNLQAAFRAGQYTEKEYKELRKNIIEGKD